jgi:hypothetical protein
MHVNVSRKGQRVSVESRSSWACITKSIRPGRAWRACESCKPRWASWACLRRACGARDSGRGACRACCPCGARDSGRRTCRTCCACLRCTCGAHNAGSWACRACCACLRRACGAHHAGRRTCWACCACIPCVAEAIRTWSPILTILAILPRYALNSLKSLLSSRSGGSLRPWHRRNRACGSSCPCGASETSVPLCADDGQSLLSARTRKSSRSGWPWDHRSRPSRSSWPAWPSRSAWASRPSLAGGPSKGRFPWNATRPRGSRELSKVAPRSGLRSYKYWVDVNTHFPLVEAATRSGASRPTRG